MKAGKRKTNVLLILGILLLAGAAGLMLFTRIRGSMAVQKAQELSQKLYALMPDRFQGVPDDRSDTAMPVAEVDGTDFCGTIEIPAYGTLLPVCGEWNTSKLSAYPCRFYGSIYDRSLIIGGSDQRGQFDFCKQIDIGQAVIITDMTGAQFTYAVQRVERAQSADSQQLLAGDSDLTLFVRSAYSGEYIIVRCVLT